MKDIFQSAALVTLLAWGNAAPALAQENLPGAQLEGLLAIAKANNPDYASMRQEAQAASERVVMADDFELDPVGFENLARHFGGGDCFFCAEAPGGVGE